MNGLTLLCTIAGVVIVLAGITLFAAWLLRVKDEDAEIDEEMAESIERIRLMLERDTGREIAIVYRKGGHWHAVVARGSVPVSDLLKSGYIRVGGVK